MARRPQPLRRRNLDGEIARPRDFLEGTKIMVPSKGLEPPHRCRYMDLNHARLPIPPRWQSELQCSGGPKAAVSGRPTFPFLQPATSLSNAAASAPGTFPTTSRWLAVIVQPESSFSMVSVTFVLMLSGVRFAPPSCAESAIEKHAAFAAAINSSGFVPGPFSNREVNEYCVSFNTPPGAEIVPLPSFNPPFHTALALRSIVIS